MCRGRFSSSNFDPEGLFLVPPTTAMQVEIDRLAGVSCQVCGQPKSKARRISERS